MIYRIIATIALFPAVSFILGRIFRLFKFNVFKYIDEATESDDIIILLNALFIAVVLFCIDIAISIYITHYILKL